MGDTDIEYRSDSLWGGNGGDEERLGRRATSLGVVLLSLAIADSAATSGPNR